MYFINDSTKKIRLAEFPDYTCYTLRFEELVKEETMSEQRINDYSVYDGYRTTEYCLIPDETEHYASIFRPITKGKLEEGDKLLLHPKCDIPSTMIKRWETVSSVSKNVPTKYVVPMRGNGGGRTLFTVRNDNSVVFINEERKQVILIANSWYSTGNDRLYDADLFTRALHQELYDSQGFKLMGGVVKYYKTVSFVNPVDYSLLNGIIPPECIINEADIPVGEERITKELILNAYRLLKSTDEHVRNTGLMTLAQRDCSGFEELLGWLFYYHDDSIYTLKARNSAFRWLAIRVDEYGRFRHGRKFFQFWSIRTAKWFVQQITDGKVFWNEEDTLCINDQSVIDKPLRKLIEHIL